MAISKNLLFGAVLFLVGFLLASSEPADNRRLTPRRPPPPSPPPPLPASPPPSPPPPPPDTPKFDYFMLSLQWPNAVCIKINTCKPSKPKQYFTIHGLWPQRNDYQRLEYCVTDKKMTDDILNKEEFRNDLLQYWPRLFSADDFAKSKKFWKEQWDKHGSCSSEKFLPEAYLRATIKLGKDYAPLITEKLEKGFKQDRSTKHKEKDILKAIWDVEGIKKAALITCTKDKSGILQLDSIRLCFQADGKTLQDCISKYPKGSCSDKDGFIFPPPPTETRSCFPSFVSSMLDVEEAIGI